LSFLRYPSSLLEIIVRLPAKAGKAISPHKRTGISPVLFIKRRIIYFMVQMYWTQTKIDAALK